MRKIKIITFYFISFIGVILFLQGCKNESLYIEPEHTHPNFDLKKIGYSTFVNDPSINTALKPYLKDISENPLEKDNNQFLLLSLDQITKITTSQNETYTFEILNPLLDGSTYENLLIKKTGNELSFTYVQYICYDNHFENFDVYYFPVNISGIDFENEIFGKGVNKLMVAGLSDEISEQSTSANSGGGSGCARYIYEACYLPNGMRGGCDGHAPACQHPNLTTEEREEHNRNGCNYQCSGSAIIAIDLTGCVEGSSSGSDDSYGSNGNPLDETNQSSNTGGGGSGNTNTSSVDGTASDYTLTSPTYGGGSTTVSFELINMLGLENLSQDQLIWINTQSSQVVNQIIGFLLENNNSPESIQLILDLSDQSISGNIDFNDAINNIDVFDSKDPSTSTIIDLQNDIIDCFDTQNNDVGTHYITLYIDQPIANSNNTYAITADGVEVGHSFISLEQQINGISNIKTFGLYPSEPVNPDNPSTSPIFYDDGNHPFDVSISIPIDPLTFDYMIYYIMNLSMNPVNYNLNTFNCSDFALNITNISGANIPDTFANWSIMGNTLGGGTNPGSLGQDIRNLTNLPSGSTRNSNGGVSQTSNPCQ